MIAGDAAMKTPGLALASWFFLSSLATVGLAIGRHDPKLVRKVFIDFQDRILFGTDFMVSPGGTILGAGPVREDPAEVARFFEAHWTFLETHRRQFDHPTPIQGNWRIDGLGLPRDVLVKIYRDNAVRLLKLDS